MQQQHVSSLIFARISAGSNTTFAVLGLSQFWCIFSSVHAPVEGSQAPSRYVYVTIPLQLCNLYNPELTKFVYEKIMCSPKEKSLLK